MCAPDGAGQRHAGRARRRWPPRTSAAAARSAPSRRAGGPAWPRAARRRSSPGARNGLASCRAMTDCGTTCRSCRTGSAAAAGTGSGGASGAGHARPCARSSRIWSSVPGRSIGVVGEQLEQRGVARRGRARVSARPSMRFSCACRAGARRGRAFASARSSRTSRATAWNVARRGRRDLAASRPPATRWTASASTWTAPWSSRRRARRNAGRAGLSRLCARWSIAAATGAATTRPWWHSTPHGVDRTAIAYPGCSQLDPGSAAEPAFGQPAHRGRRSPVTRSVRRPLRSPLAATTLSRTSSQRPRSARGSSGCSAPRSELPDGGSRHRRSCRARRTHRRGARRGGRRRQDPPASWRAC